MRILVRGVARAGETVELDDDEAHHLRVRRATDGERVELRNGEGLLGAGALLDRGRSWRVEVQEVQLESRPAEMLLAVAAGDRERFAWMIEKLSELGATDLVPLETERTRAVASRIRPAHLEKLRRRALESVKQSGAAWALRVHDAVDLSAFVAGGAGDSAMRWLADELGAPPADPAGPQSVAIGPEGGFTDAERELLLAAGWRTVRFAAHTLRFETAAVAAAAWIAAARERNRQ